MNMLTENMGSIIERCMDSRFYPRPQTLKMIATRAIEKGRQHKVGFCT